MPTNKDTKYQQVRADIEKELQRLYKIAEDREYFTIRIENNKYLEREYESEIKALVYRGEGELAEEYKNNKKEVLKEMAKILGGETKRKNTST